MAKGRVVSKEIKMGLQRVREIVNEDEEYDWALQC